MPVSDGPSSTHPVRSPWHRRHLSVDMKSRKFSLPSPPSSAAVVVSRGRAKHTREERGGNEVRYIMPQAE